MKLRAWTVSSSQVIVFECSPAYDGGLYPFGWPHVWTHLATVIPVGPVYDSAGAEAFSASRSRIVPDEQRVAGMRRVNQLKLFTPIGLTALIV